MANKGNERYHVVVALVDARYIDGPMIYQFCDLSTDSKESALKDLNRVVRKANPFLKGKKLFPKQHELPEKARGKTMTQWFKELGLTKSGRVPRAVMKRAAKDLEKVIQKKDDDVQEFPSETIHGRPPMFVERKPKKE